MHKESLRLLPSGRNPRSVCDLLRLASLSPRGVTLVKSNDEEERRSYAELWEGARRRAAALRLRGLERGDRVLVILPTSFEFIEMFFGVLLAGGVPVPAYPPMAMARLESYQKLLSHIVTNTGTRLVVTDRTIGAMIGTLFSTCPSLEGILDLRTVQADPGNWQGVAPQLDDLCFIQCTSGSTSAPRAVQLSHRSLLANLRAIADRFGLHDGDVGVSWLPLYHDMGLIGAVLAMMSQPVDLVLLPPDLFLFDVGAWWRAISRHRGTITAGPNFGYSLSLRRLGPEDLVGLDLSSLRIALCGAEPIQPDRIRRFNQLMAHAGMDPGALLPAYGLAESCLAVTLCPPGKGLRSERVSRAALANGTAPCAVLSGGDDATVESVCLGPPVLGTRVHIVDGNGQELPERAIGEVVVEGPSLMAGYQSNIQATQDTLQGGRLHSGDLGYLAHGELYLVGRLKNMLIVRGRNYYAEDIEAAVEEVAGVRRGSAVAFGDYDHRGGRDRLNLAVETRLTGAAARQLAETISASVSETVGLTPHQVSLMAPGTLPKTSSGKKRRHAAAAGERAQTGGSLGGIATLARSQAGHVLHALRRATGRHKVQRRPDSRLAFSD